MVPCAPRDARQDIENSLLVIEEQDAFWLADRQILNHSFTCCRVLLVRGRLRPLRLVVVHPDDQFLGKLLDRCRPNGRQIA